MIRVLALLFLLLLALPARADGPYGGAFPDPTQNGDPNATYLTLSTSTLLNNERVFSPSARFQITDNGPGGTYILELATVPLTHGGTGGATAQAGFNNLADGTSGAAATSQDLLVRGGTNWGRLAVGSNGQFLGIVGGAVAWTSSPAGAPTDAQYVVTANHAGLSAEDVLTQGSGVTISGGGTGTVTVAVDSTVVRTTGNQTVDGTKTFSAAPIVPFDLGVIWNGSSFTTTIVAADPSANRIFTLPNIASANILVSEGAQTVNGTKTFSDLKLFAQTFKIVGSAERTITVPDATDTLANLSSAQELANKTYNAPIFTSGSTLTLKQSTADYTIDWNNPGGARAYHITDVGAAADFLMKAAADAYTAGALFYGDGNKLKIGPQGSSGQPLLSGGTGAYTFGTLGQAHGGTGITSYTAGDLLVANDSGTLVKLPGGSDGQTLQYDSTQNPNVKWASGGTGTVTSVALSIPDFPLVISGSPVTTSGTLTATPQAAKGDLIGGTGTNTYGRLTVGSNYQVLTADTAATTGLRYRKGRLFGGQAEGTIPTSGTLTGEYWGASWTTSGTITCNRCRIHVLGDATIAHTITVNTELAGGATPGTGGASSGRGHGFGGGNTGYATSRAGGGGGGYGGRGGDGGSNSSGNYGTGGEAYFLENYLGGSGGAAGVSNGTTKAGDGGNGGGGFYLEVGGNLTISAGLNANGGNGGTGGNGNGGGGGGSGGGIDVRVLGTITVSSPGFTWTANGGSGGSSGDTSGGRGAGGGGGIISVKSAGTLTETGTLTLQVNAGSAGGTGSSTQLPTAATAGTATKTGNTTVSFRSAN